MEIAAAIRTFVNENFILSKEGEPLDDSVSFLESGIVDSTGMLEIIEFLEERFGFAVEDDELVPENLDSIANLTRFVQSKINKPGDSIEEAA
jgi:acyl carrier protein